MPERPSLFARAIVLVLLAAGAAYGWSNFMVYYFQAPALVVLGTLVTLVMYAPSLWAIHRLAHPSQLWRYGLFSSLFVLFFATISSHSTYDAIDAGIRYWQAVGPSEEFCKMSPLLVLLLFRPGAIREMRDGIVLGAIANFPEKGFACLYTDIPPRRALGTETHILWGATTGGPIGYAVQARRGLTRWMISLTIVAVVIVTHGLQDWMGKRLAPLSLAVLETPIAKIGISTESFGPGTVANAAMLVHATTVNTVLINLPVIPILWWEGRRSRLETGSPTNKSTA